MLVVVYFVSDFENEYMTMEIKNKTKNNLTLNKPCRACAHTCEQCVDGRIGSLPSSFVAFHPVIWYVHVPDTIFLKKRNYLMIRMWFCFLQPMPAHYQRLLHHN